MTLAPHKAWSIMPEKCAMSTPDSYRQSADQNSVVTHSVGFKWLKAKEKGGPNTEKAEPMSVMLCSLTIKGS